MFVILRGDIGETSTREVKSLPGLRLALPSTYKIKIVDFDFIGARSAELRLAMLNSTHWVDSDQMRRIQHRALVKKVVNNVFPFLCQ